MLEEAGGSGVGRVGAFFLLIFMEGTEALTRRGVQYNQLVDGILCCVCVGRCTNI